MSRGLRLRPRWMAAWLLVLATACGSGKADPSVAPTASLAPEDMKACAWILDVETMIRSGESSKGQIGTEVRKAESVAKRARQGELAKLGSRVGATWRNDQKDELSEALADTERFCRQGGFYDVVYED